MNAIKSFETHVPTPPGIIRTSISRKHSTLKEIHHALEIHKFASYLFIYLVIGRFTELCLGLHQFEVQS